MSSGIPGLPLPVRGEVWVYRSDHGDCQRIGTYWSVDANEDDYEIVLRDGWVHWRTGGALDKLDAEAWTTCPEYRYYEL